MAFGVTAMRNQETDMFMKGNCTYGPSFRDFSKDFNYLVALITFIIALEDDTTL